MSKEIVVTVMKRVAVGMILALLSVFLMPTAAFGASSLAVDKVDYSAELRSDGCAYITEVWTVTFADNNDDFSREIVIPEDNFELFGELRDLTVSVDGNLCSETDAASPVNGTYSLEKTDNSYIIKWNVAQDSATHVFSLRYLKTGAVKLYNDRAYFYTTVVNETDTYGICRDVTVSITTQKQCFSEDFTVIESGSLAGKKADSEIVFAAANTAGLVKTAISMPSYAFDTSALTVIVDDTRAETAVLVILIVLLIFGAVAGYFYAKNYRRLFRSRWEKKCRKRVHKESSYEAQSQIFESLGPARVMTIVSAQTVSGADRFIVTVLDLVKRGYITLDNGGFSASVSSFSDSVKRPLDKNDKTVIELFGSDKWQKTLSRPKRFYAAVQNFNRKIPFASPFFTLTPKGKKITGRCFELKLSAKRHEFILPEEISDDIFKDGKYSVTDLLISLLNEYDLTGVKDFSKGPTDKYKRNLFLLRDIYEEGRILAEKEELRRQMQKKQKFKNKSKTVNDDDIDSQ